MSCDDDGDNDGDILQKKNNKSRKRRVTKKKVNKNQQVNENYNFYGVFDDTQLHNFFYREKKKKRNVHTERKS